MNILIRSTRLLYFKPFSTFLLLLVFSFRLHAQCPTGNDIHLRLAYGNSLLPSGGGDVGLALDYTHINSSFEWYLDGGDGFNKVANHGGSVFPSGFTGDDDGEFYWVDRLTVFKVLVKPRNGCSSFETNEVVVNVSEPVVPGRIAGPTSRTIFCAQAVAFELQGASGNSVRWEYTVPTIDPEDDPWQYSSWRGLSSNPNFTYPTSELEPGRTYEIRARVKNFEGATAVTPTVYLIYDNPSISFNLNKRKVCSGGSVTMTYTGDGSLLYYEYEEGNQWKRLNGSNSGALIQNTRFRPVVDLCGQTRIGNAELVRVEDVEGGYLRLLGATSPVRSGGEEIGLELQGYTGSRFKWYKDDGTGWELLTSNGGAVYPSGYTGEDGGDFYYLNQTTRFKVSVSNGSGSVCGDAESGSLRVLVDTPPSAGTLRGPEKLLLTCAGSQDDSFVLSNASGTQVRWEYTIPVLDPEDDPWNITNWKSLNEDGSSSFHYPRSEMEEGTYQVRVRVRNQSGEEVLSNTLNVQVDPTVFLFPTAIEIEGPGRLCASLQDSYTFGVASIDPQFKKHYAWELDGTRLGSNGLLKLYPSALSNGAHILALKLTLTDPCGRVQTLEAEQSLSVHSACYNLISTEVLRVSEDEEANLSHMPVEEKLNTFAYYDGLGRPQQTVIQQSSPGKEDMIRPIAYDVFGRIAKQYLPYAGGVSGDYHPDALPKESYTNGEQYGFYQSASRVAHDGYPYGEIVYESSPLNRVKSQYGAGQAWRDGSGKFVATGYGSNTSADNVQQWHVEIGAPVLKDPYAPGQLYKTLVRDEEGLEALEFKDHQGRVILKRVQADEEKDEWADTYYVYDIFNNLCYVFPPQLVEEIGVRSAGYVPSDQLLKYWAFQYIYDGRNRMTRKQVPGSDYVSLVYDSRDRLVLTQDGNQREGDKNEWLFVKYDALNRAVVTGVIDLGNQSLSNIRSEVGSSSVLYEQRGDGLFGYTNRSYPKNIAEAQVLSVTYYDDYGFPHASEMVFEANEWNATAFDKVKGQVTGSKTRVLETDAFLNSALYYDDRYRVIQTQSDNHKGGVDVVSNQYDFIGQLMETKTVHEVAAGSHHQTQEEVRHFEYDHAGRLLKMWHQLNDEPEVLVLENHYNALGELTEKNLHGKEGAQNYEQSVDYRYNIRGWLISINNADLSIDERNDDTNDLFGFELNYTTRHHMDDPGQYNGNIAETIWKTAVDDQQVYNHYYDAMNRLVRSQYANVEDANQYNHHSVGLGSPVAPFYDLNGNILRFDRRGGDDGRVIDELHYTYRGNQLINVHDASNDPAGFQDDERPGDDYGYDSNGNMVRDSNKEITNIDYNHLNLPERVVFANGDYLTYLYDATGVKLQKRVYEDGAHTRTTDYVGSYLYENDTLQLIQHEEGRIIPMIANEGGSMADWDYQYHLKDHLGNVRLTFSTSNESYAMTETFESGEDHGFQSVRRKVSSSTNTTPGGNEVQMLSSGQIGAMVLLGLNKGDTVHLSVNASYLEQPTENTLEFLSGLTIFNTVEAAYVGGGEGIIPIFNEDPFFDAVASMADKIVPSQAPRAFLNYILFDDEMRLVTQGFQQISTQANGVGAHETISLNNIIAHGEGYILAYLTNENLEFSVVHFDDFTVHHKKTNVVQSDNYYPFGLTFNSYQRTAATPQNFLYNGMELQEETQIYSADYRSYDPAVARFTSVDPLSQLAPSWTPYRFGFNDPIRFSDPSGLFEADQNEDRDVSYTDPEQIIEVFNDLVERFGNNENAEDENEGEDSNEQPEPESLLGYKVRNGDTLWEIARRYGVSVDYIKKINGLKGDLIRTGSTLTIPIHPSLKKFEELMNTRLENGAKLGDTPYGLYLRMDLYDRMGNNEEGNISSWKNLRFLKSVPRGLSPAIPYRRWNSFTIDEKSFLFTRSILNGSYDGSLKELMKYKVK